jgi:hypothetical protein
MTAPNAANGKVPARKQLSDQLDRLDGILDAIAEGLPGAVADACRDGTKAAVREVLMELISNPDIIAAVRATAPAPTVVNVTPDAPAGLPAGGTPSAPAPETSFWGRVKETAKSVVTTVTDAAQTLAQAVRGAAKSGAEALPTTGTTKTLIAVAVAVGLCAGAATLVCPAWVAAAVTGITGAAVVAGHIGASVNALFARLRLSD